MEHGQGQFVRGFVLGIVAALSPAAVWALVLPPAAGSPVVVAVMDGAHARVATVGESVAPAAGLRLVQADEGDSPLPGADTLDQAEEAAGAAERALQTFADEFPALSREMRATIEATRPLLRELTAVAEEAQPLLAALTAAAEDTRPLLRELTAATADARPLMRQTAGEAQEAARAFASAGREMGALAAENRVHIHEFFSTSLPQLGRLLAQADRLAFVTTRIAEEVERDLPGFIRGR
jgi:hypothetical protein